jgi:uncharacterized protein YyaL (SSP411 family)
VNERLASSTSPYLRAHAANPVAWYPWGEAAFDEARRRDVPVMVSIGYSTCHWCHVMARESFEDAATAAVIDDGFVAVKVDREEHPHVDAAYMAAAAAFTRGLGWPLTVFVTPEGRPFFAGTYFPPEPRGGMPSFTQVLHAVTEAWTTRRSEVDATASAVVAALADLPRAGPGQAGPPSAATVADAARALAAHEDARYGGLTSAGPHEAAPKFPVATALRFLQHPLVSDAAPEAAAVADRALGAMSRSPLRDAVEGGFFRYATRPDWTVPHYERMLTDNAQLLDVAAAAGPRAGVDLAHVAAGIAAFLTGTLRRAPGGFGAAQDSESWIDGARDEGGYYRRDASGRAGLEPPAVDAKVVSGWNGLAMGALCRAGIRFSRADWVEAARRAAEAVLAANVDVDGMLHRASLDGTLSPARGTLADHGQLAEGLVALAAATGEARFATRARELVAACLDATGGLRAPGGDDPVLAAGGVQAPPGASDADEPSGPASIAAAALALWQVGAGDRWRLAAEAVVAAWAPAALAQPLGHGTLLRVAASLARAPRQVVVVSDVGGTGMHAALAEVRADAVVQVTSAQAEEWAAAGFGLLEGKVADGGVATAYDCRDFACRLPTTDPAGLART